MIQGCNYYKGTLALEWPEKALDRSKIQEIGEKMSQIKALKQVFPRPKPWGLCGNTQKPSKSIDAKWLVARKSHFYRVFLKKTLRSVFKAKSMHSAWSGADTDASSATVIHTL